MPTTTILAINNCDGYYPNWKGYASIWLISIHTHTWHYRALPHTNENVIFCSFGYVIFLLGQDESRCNRCIMHVISVMVWVVVGIVPTFVAFQFILMHLWRGYKQNSTKAKDKCGEESNFPRHSSPSLWLHAEILNPTSANHSFSFRLWTPFFLFLFPWKFKLGKPCYHLKGILDSLQNKAIN